MLPVLAVAAVVLAGYSIFLAGDRRTLAPQATADHAGIVPVARKAESLDDLLKMTPEQLAEVDIAEMNLLCATGLPGAENLDIDHALATLNQWAQRVKSETERHLYRLHDPKWAALYHHSEAYLRAYFLVQVLQLDLGVKYDMTAKDDFDFDDSRVPFLHGMIPAKGETAADTKGGTCASMPVMYVAVGRRLGYPVKLVTTRGHVFLRWDGGDHPNPAWRERFNIEGSGDGFGSFSDEYYRSWPFKLTEQEVRVNRHLVSLAPAEELAEFLLARGHCRVDNGQIALAAHCYENAYLFDSVRPGSREWFLEAAVESGYRPATPALARMLDDRKRRIAAARSGRPDPRAMPRPGGMAVRGDVYRPPAYGASPWPGIPQPQAFQVLQPRLPGPYVPPGPAQPPRP